MLQRVIFTDGAALRNGRRDAKGGWAFFYKLDGRVFGGHDYETFGEQTNNWYELFAILKGLQDAHEDDIGKITIKTDSMYAINCITKFYWHWRKNGWITCAGHPVKNRNLIESIRSLIFSIEDEGGSVDFEHVRGHQNNYLNNLADQYARLAAFENPIHDYQKYPKYRNIPNDLMNLMQYSRVSKCLEFSRFTPTAPRNSMGSHMPREDGESCVRLTETSTRAAIFPMDYKRTIGMSLKPSKKLYR